MQTGRLSLRLAQAKASALLAGSEHRQVDRLKHSDVALFVRVAAIGGETIFPLACPLDVCDV